LVLSRANAGRGCEADYRADRNARAKDSRPSHSPIERLSRPGMDGAGLGSLLGASDWAPLRQGHSSWSWPQTPPDHRRFLQGQRQAGQRCHNAEPPIGRVHSREPLRGAGSRNLAQHSIPPATDKPRILRQRWAKYSRRLMPLINHAACQMATRRTTNPSLGSSAKTWPDPRHRHTFACQAQHPPARTFFLSYIALKCMKPT
jgi:hypothetical protein